MKTNAYRLARENLRNHKTRSRISTIGIVISVFLVSTIFIISDSVKTSLINQTNAFHKNTLIINGESDSNLLDLPLSTPRNTLTTDDVTKIKGLTKQKVNSNLFINGQATSDGISQKTTVVATTFDKPESLGLSIVNGNWIDVGDDKNWVVLGDEIANQLLGMNKAQNQVINFKGQRFTVIGVLKKVNQPLSISGYNPNKSIFMSLENGRAIEKGNKIGQISVNNVNDVNKTKKQISAILNNQHVDTTEYVIDTSQNISNKLTVVVNIITIIACSLACMILLISCVSIANLMLVNVVERRREIGIRKAVGATTHNIMGQFIVESIIMSVRGGVVGLLLAYAFTFVCLLFMSIDITFSWLALGFGFIVPMVIGIIAGTYPAYKASKQDIITALNQLT